ncbi:MAG: glycerol-3-phosphate dehydrogenase/oxidase [Anaerolineales bacterium]|nr:glycerol-3-phosphate dehydrogenase/oxidase [Anaerolineales bacterium]
MWQTTWRETIWQQLDQEWDLLIVGGGITGGGILREAARLGLKALLVEQRDFAWGTSSRSSKLVHGGLRYLKEGKFGLTLTSVQERQTLLADGPGLIDPLGFLLASYEGDKVGRWVYQAGLTVYDLLALQWSHRFYDSRDFRMLAPHVTARGLRGGFRYGDAQTDDARLVLRVLREAVADGGVAINYVSAEDVLRDENGRVCGLRLLDVTNGATAEVRGKAVISATGAWADKLRQQVGGERRIRPLRGSHLVFPQWRLPVAQAVSYLHPIDQRPIMIFPWEGVTLVGTTDLDHAQDLNAEPAISPAEVAYLMAAVTSQFPSLGITLDDVIASFAGVRPVIGTGKDDPSQESRDHVVWQEAGLLTVTGGKLTTFRVIALDALAALRLLLPEMPEPAVRTPVLDPVAVALPGAEALDARARTRLLGRYGVDAAALVAAAQPGELQPVPQARTLWAELRWGARAEGVVHLDDLLLRRTRLGLLLPHGGAALLPRIRQICQPELGWDDARWEAEVAAYEKLIACCYALPPREAIPDWREMLAKARHAAETAVAPPAPPVYRRPRWLVAALLALSTTFFWRRLRQA